MAVIKETDLNRGPKNGFVKVKCEGCGNEQVVFSVPAMEVKCLVCNQVLAESTGHKAKFKAKEVSKIE
jgi:small subunit ribosomal protein S27e